MISHRKEIMARIRGEVVKRNAAAGFVVQGNARKRTPVGTPESTGIEGYRGGRLAGSITNDPRPEGVIIGTNVRYGIYVHNGTYGYRHEGEWTEAEMAELTSLADTGGEGGSTKGMAPRPFLVEGLLDSRPAPPGERIIVSAT